MFGFPINSGGSGFESLQEKFTNNADSGFPKIQQREVFYTMRDGVYESMQWITASGRVGLIPSANDDVYIRHNVNIGFTIPILNNLIISQNATFGLINANTIIRCNSFKNYGTFNAASFSGFRLELYGNGHYFGNSSFGTNSVQYLGTVEQTIEPFTYPNLVLTNSNKILKSDLVVTNGFLLQNNGVLNLAGYNLTSLSTSSIGARLIASASSKILFIGAVTLDQNAIPTIYFEGNVDVEFRNGVNFNYWNTAAALVSGTGTWRFTTNNQSISTINSSQVNLNCKISIADGITLTNNSASSTLNLYNEFNGEGAGSVFINKGTVNFMNDTSVPLFMTTGTHNFTSFANTIGYTGNYSATIPSYLTNFHNLTISGTGTKTLGVNTTLNGNLTSSNSGNLQLSTYNLTVSGTSTLQGTGTIYPLQKSGAGTVTFIGQIISGNGTYFLDFSTGNPTVYVRGGIVCTNTNTTAQFKSGIGTWYFDTNSQAINNPGAGSNVLFFDGPILIDSGITLTIGGTTSSNTVVLNNVSGINGISATSTLINASTGVIRFDVNATLMSTGIFNPSLNSSSTLHYNFSGNYTLPYTSFGNLTISNSGTKTLSGNTTVNNLSVSDSTNGAVLECSTYNLTINGTTVLANKFTDQTYYILKKSGAGNVLFTGLITLANNSQRLIDFSGGNPTVELRGGITVTNPFTTQIKTGTGTWTFSTNNQNIIQTGGTGTIQFDTTILISGAITLSQVNSSASAFTIVSTGNINGNNVSSRYTMGTATGTNTMNYQNATQPMATGILDTSTNLNTWIYGNSNQDIKGGPTTLAKQVYRNLTLNGGGTKTLQGYVSVLNTYTLTAPATLALNGFTLTNP